MKTFSFIIAFICLLGVSPTISQDKQEPVKAVIEVYYFHGNYRCPTCLAVEDQTKKALAELYSKELESGTIILKVLNLEEKSNQELVERFEIGWSSLILYKPGTKEKINLTEDGFATAKSDPAAFRQTLKKQIDRLIG